MRSRAWDRPPASAPDPETGLGRWSVDTFVAAMRTGRHEGKGRPILPPMPVENLAALSDGDIAPELPSMRPPWPMLRRFVFRISTRRVDVARF